MAWFKGKVSLKPSASRWGFSALLFSACLFFLALSPSFYSVYLSLVGGTLVAPFSPSLMATLALVTGIMGVIFGLLAAGFSIYWLVIGSQDRTDEKLDTIIANVREILADIRREGSGDGTSQSAPGSKP